MTASWPREFGQAGGYLQHFQCLDEGRKIAARSWPKLDLVVIFPSGPDSLLITALLEKPDCSDDTACVYIVVKCIGEELGNERGLDIVEVVVDIFVLVVNVLLLVIRPEPVPNSPL